MSWVGEDRRVEPEEILEPLDPDQRAVAVATTGPVAVLAGAGTGKTRALTSSRGPTASPLASWIRGGHWSSRSRPGRPGSSVADCVRWV